MFSRRRAITPTDTDQLRDNLDLLLAAVTGQAEIFVIPHNDPDPDAIASAVALQYMLQQLASLKVQIGYRGIIGRAENRALVRYLSHPLVPMGSDIAAGKPVEYLVIEGEGHRIRHWKNRLKVYRATEDFLADCLGGRSSGFDYYQLGGWLF